MIQLEFENIKNAGVQADKLYGENLMNEVYARVIELEEIVELLDLTPSVRASIQFELNRWTSIVEDELDRAAQRTRTAQ
jgi:hypothetical protein